MALHDMLGPYAIRLQVSSEKLPPTVKRPLRLVRTLILPPR